MKDNPWLWRIIPIVIPLIFVVGGFVVTVQVMKVDTEYQIASLQKEIENLKGNPHGIDVEKIVASHFEKYKELYAEKFKNIEKNQQEMKDEIKDLRKDLVNVQFKIYRHIKNGRRTK